MVNILLLQEPRIIDIPQKKGDVEEILESNGGMISKKRLECN